MQMPREFDFGPVINYEFADADCRQRDPQFAFSGEAPSILQVSVHDRVGQPRFVRAVARPVDVLDDAVVQVEDLAASNPVVLQGDAP
jgi:hypothetical protein